MSNNNPEIQNKNLENITPEKGKSKKSFLIPALSTLLVFIIIATAAFFFLDTDESDKSKTEEEASAEQIDPDNISLNSDNFEKLEKDEQIQNLTADLENAIESLDETIEFDPSLISDESLSIEAEQEAQVEEE